MTIMAVYTVLCSVTAFAIDIKRVEPLNWWVGMKTPLQIMFYGDGIGSCSVEVSGVVIKKVHKADSPNYLFVDVEVPSDAKPGEYIFYLKDGNQQLKVPYQIMARNPLSANKKGFNSSDVIMLYMPDRIGNGDPKNDNTDNTAEKADKTNANGRHGGDIQGVINQLDYWAQLGVTAIWGTPFLLDNEPRGSYHGYACADYYAIDPRYGDNDLFKTLVEQAHQRGMKVVMDVVTNHCGTAHWWMLDYPFTDWINPYSRNSVSMVVASDPNASEIDKASFHTSWFAPSMPDMNLANPFVVKYFTQWAIWWVEWSGLDSFRVDTFPYNDKEGIGQWCANVRNEYPGISIVGECWMDSPLMVSYWDGDSHNYDGYSSHLTSVMDFPLYSAIINALRPPRTSENGAPAQGRRGNSIEGVYNVLTQDFAYPDPQKIMIFAGNHDTNRLADDLDGDPKRVNVAITLIATLRGIPQIYYGNEIMFRLTAGERPSDGSKRVDFPGDLNGLTSYQQAVYQHTGKLFNWRKTAEVIHTGKTRQFRPVKGVYTYFRYNATDKVMVVVNGSDQPASFDWERVAEMTGDISKGRDVITGIEVTVGEPFSINPMESAVIEFKR